MNKIFLMQFYKILSLCLFFVSQSVFANEKIECKEYLLKNVKWKEVTEFKETICLSKKGHYSYSNKCQSKSCDIIKKMVSARKDRDKFEVLEIGSPGFQLCYFVGGEPEILEIKNFNKTKGWSPYSICRSMDDQSFVDMNFLWNGF